MLTAIALATALAAPDAKADLQAVFKNYKSLKSYSATIECQDASGLYPGHYVLELKWKGDKKFELKVVEPTTPTPSSPGNPVPSYVSDGANVTTYREGHEASVRELNTDPNISPGYEVATGLLLTALLDSPNAKMFFDPPKEFKIDYSYGKTNEWKGTKVKEIVMSMEAGGQKLAYSVFLSEDGKWLVGAQHAMNGKTGWIHYKNAKA
jgi:hypothetical protein